MDKKLFNNNFLTRLHANIIAAEAALLDARDRLRQEFKREGKPTSGIFSEMQFVPRDWANQQVAEARAEARAEGQRAIEKLLEATPGPAPKNENEAHWMRLREAMIAGERNSKQFKIDPSKCDASYLAMRKQADLIVNLSKVAESVGLTLADIMPEGQLAPKGGRTLAQRIVASAAKARGEKTGQDDAGNEGDDSPNDPHLVEVGDDDPAGMAKKIIAAARKARGEPEPEGRRQPLLRVVGEEPFAPTAAQIIAAGRKARKPMGSD